MVQNSFFNINFIIAHTYIHNTFLQIQSHIYNKTLLYILITVNHNLYQCSCDNIKNATAIYVGKTLSMNLYIRTIYVTTTESNKKQ